MANKAHLAILRKGVDTWNAWRDQHHPVWPDLSGAHLNGKDLFKANFWGANLHSANLDGANLRRADLYEANLSRANLGGANLRGANLCDANLNGADLSGAELYASVLVRTDLRGAKLDGCVIYGISAWDLKLNRKTSQCNLRINPYYQDAIEVDDLEVAQFIYLLLSNKKIRRVIDTITSKVVLILGNFSKERKPILERIRERLRERGYVPVLFDFEKPVSRDMTETITTLAHMSRFVFADITDPRSVPHELAKIVPELSVPVQPLILASQKRYAMVEGLCKYGWFLRIFRYDNARSLTNSLDKLIEGAEVKVKELAVGRLARLKDQE